MIELPYEELFFLHGSIVVLTLLLVKIAKLPLLKFTILYVVMSSINVLIHEMIAPGEYLVSTIVVSAVGLFVTVLLAGLVGDGMNSSNYSSIMAFVGLSPWYLSWGSSILLFVLSVVIIAVYSFVKQSRAFKAVGHQRYVSMKLAKQKMKEEDFEIFLKKSNVIFAVPMIVGILVSLFLIGA